MVQTHILSVPLAVKYGANESLFLSSICCWLEKNRANNKHFHEGRYWTYNTIEGFTELFPYFTANQIQHLISKLRDKKKNILLVGNFNKIGYDRTNWYSVSDEVMDIYLAKKEPVRDSEDTPTPEEDPPKQEPAPNDTPTPEEDPPEQKPDSKDTPSPEDAPHGGGGLSPEPASEDTPPPLPEEGGGPPPEQTPPILPNGKMHSGNFHHPFSQTGKCAAPPPSPEAPPRPAPTDAPPAEEAPPDENGGPPQEQEPAPADAPPAEEAPPDESGGPPQEQNPPILPNGKMHSGNFHHPFSQTGKCIYEISQIDSGNFHDRFGKFPEPIPDHKPVVKPVAAASGKKPQAPLHSGTAATAALQKVFAKIDPSLIFSGTFYPRAAAFMHANSLDENYPIWLYKECLSRKPDSLRGLYYHLFFEDDMLALFLQTRKKERDPPRITAVSCPVCGKEHGEYEECPECGLPAEDRKDEGKIARQKRLYALSPEEKRAYEAELHETAAAFVSGNLRVSLRNRRELLDKKYGLTEPEGTSRNQSVPGG
jgi:hypothetical protein